MDYPYSQGGVRTVNAIDQATQKQSKQETGDVPGNLIVFDIRKLTRFHEKGPDVQVLSDIGAARLVLFSFQAGQQLKEHTTSSQLLVQVLRGRIRLTAAGNSVKLQAGMVVQVEAQVPHQVVALTPAVLLVTMVPSPAYHSLEREVFQSLTPLVTRTASASNEKGESAPKWSLSRASEESIEHQEFTHVFHCMQCDLQFQMDLDVASHEGSQEIDAGVIRVRLDPHIKLEREDVSSSSSD
jgi:quercetin dioxygenase-like cupin family protein